MNLNQLMISQIDLIKDAFTPRSKDVQPELTIIDIPTFPRKSKNNQLIFNPLTNNYVQNVQPNRYRIKKQIESINEKRKQHNKQREEAIKNNTILNNYLNTSDIKDIFSNYARLYVNLQNINSLEEYYNTVKYLIQHARQILKNYVISSVNLWWINDRNQALIRSINTSFFDKRMTYSSFENEIERLQGGLGETAGSDPIDTNEYKFSFNRFGVFLKKLVGNKALRNIFNIVGIDGDGKCFNRCLEYLNLLPAGGNDYYKNYDNFLKFIIDNEIKVNVVSNIINNIDLRNIDDGELYAPIIEGKGKKAFVYKLNQKRIEVKYLHTNEEAENTLLYCEIDNHIDIIKNNNVSLCDDIFVSTDGNIYKGDNEVVNKLYSVSDIYKHTSKKKEIINEVKYVCFDYETILDWDDDNVMKPYSISFNVFSHNEMIEIIKSNIDENNELLMSVLRDKQRCFNYVGYDASEFFIKWILENQKYNIFKFISFNGANFDNIILLRSILELRQQNTHDKDDLCVFDIQYNNNQLLNFKFNGRHTFFDLRKHLIGKLSDNCDSFKVPKEFCKLTFNHNEIQIKYNSYEDKNMFIDEMKKQEELEKYNNNDVLSLSVLFMKYYQQFTQIPGFEFLNQGFCNYSTIGKIISTKFQNHIKKSKINLPKLDITQYEDMQKYKIAGRCEMFNGKQKLINEPICSLDICSMYPYVMTIKDVYYPAGEIKRATKYYKSSDKLGFWYCDIDQTALKKHNLPNIYAEKTGIENDWGSQNILNKYLLSNVSIDLLLKYEYLGVKVKIYNTVMENNIKKHSFYFTDKIKSINMFGFLAELMKEKNKQDTYKKNKDSQYNPALREVLKLAMNSLSGKVIQGLFLDKIAVCSNSGEFEKINLKHETNIINYMGDKLFVSYKADISECIKRQSPIYLGCFIYEYARTYMYDVLLSRVGLDKCLYQDTDCLKFRVSDMNKWIDKYGSQPVPHWEEAGIYDERYNDNHPLYSANSKVFGSFENEIDDNNLFILLQKKMWLVAKTDTDNKPTYIKCRFKGINSKSLLLNLDEHFIEKKKDDYVVKTDIKDIELFNWSYENSDKREISMDYDFYKNDGKIGNQIEFFNRVYDNGFSYVLCSNFRRVIKNTNRNVDVKDTIKYNNNNNTIQMVYIVKKISIVS